MRHLSRAIVTTTFAVLVIALGTLAFADDGYVSEESGGAVVMSKSPSIRMVSETVRITDLPKGRVNAVFTFKNTGPATDCLIGFPESNSGVDSQPIPLGGSPLVDFRSWVDGRPVKVVRNRAADESADEDYKAFWVKRVHFRAHQTRIIEDSYTGTEAGDSTGFSYFDYILQTGSSWDGPIGKAVVIADVRGLEDVDLCNIQPDGYVRTPTTVRWTFRNLVPDNEDDISIGWYPGFFRVVIDGKQVTYANISGLSGPDGAYDPRDQTSATIFPKRVGNNVLLPAKTAAQWLGARFAVEKPGKVVRLELGRRWVQAVTGSRFLTSSTGQRIPMPAAAVFQSDKPTGHAYTLVYLATIVRALGGEARFDARRDVMVVRCATR